MTLHFKMAMPDLQMVLKKASSDQGLIRYPCFCFFKLFLFISGFSAIFARAILVFKKQWLNYPIKHVKVRKTMLTSAFLMRSRFQGYHCKSSFSIFVWKVKLKHIYSPLTSRYSNIFYKCFDYCAQSSALS